MKTTFLQRYKYAVVYNFTRLGSFWKGWAEAIDVTWDEIKDLALSLLRVPIGLFICAAWPVVALIAAIGKCLIWPSSYVFTKIQAMEDFMQKHPDPAAKSK